MSVFGSAFGPPSPPTPDIDARLAHLTEVLETVAGFTRLAHLAELIETGGAVTHSPPVRQVASRTAVRDRTGGIAYIIEADDQGEEIRRGTVVRDLAGGIDRVEYRPGGS